VTKKVDPRDTFKDSLCARIRHLEAEIEKMQDQIYILKFECDCYD
jgi:hypothetical protein